MNFSMRELVSILKADMILGNPKSLAERAVVDSRTVKSGDLFFALKGERTDGHLFAQSAVVAGAAGVVVNRIDWLRHRSNLSTTVLQVENTDVALRTLAVYLRQNFKGPVVGVTGSNGKTTTKQMIASVMRNLGHGLETRGNLNSQIGLPLMLTELNDTHRWMALELGASEPGNIASLAEIARPVIGVLTSLGPAHLKSFGSLAKVASTKWELMESLPQDGMAILPWGEPLLEPHVRSFSKKIIFFGEDATCAVRATNIQVGKTIEFKLHVGGSSFDVRLPIAGRFNVSNALAAAAVGWVLKIKTENIVAALEKFEPAEMRMQQVPHASGALLINDAYNANPASVTQSVRSFVESFSEKKKYLVLGSMLELGDDADRMHFHLGSELAKLPLEHVYLFGPEMLKLQEGAEAGGAPAKRFEYFESHDQIAAALRPHLSPDCAVLFKGSRGTKMETVVDLLVGGR